MGSVIGHGFDSRVRHFILYFTLPVVCSIKEMLDEGVAREVVNRVQKLRKSAGLKVDDQVTMLYSVSPASHHLASVIKKFSDYIQTSSKTPLELLTSQPQDYIKKESYDLKGAKL